MTRHLAIALSFLISSLQSEEISWDWRLALLKQEGIEVTPEGLRNALKKESPAPKGLKLTVERLGSAEFTEREAAEKELIRGGKQVYRWLKDQEPSLDPEIRKRIENILTQLGLNQRKDREEALEFAIKSLLKEGDERRSDTGGRFYEWFGEDKLKIEDHYHLSQLKNQIKRDCSIEKGRLTLSGNGGKDGDQRLVLDAKSWPARDTFGRKFTVSAKLGGENKSSGSWHLGISIGNVRALYHPGYPGGGFRFETVNTNKHLSETTINMGFTPSDKSLERMTIEVEKLADGKVSLNVTVSEGAQNPKTFTKRLIVSGKEIGPLNQIGLDRSGRSGGSAFFSDFSITLAH